MNEIKNEPRCMKVGERTFVETVCQFCDMTFFVPKGSEKDYICLDCKEHFKREMMDGTHECYKG